MKKQKKEYKFNCQKCGKQYTVELTQNNFKKGNYKKNCSRKCANKRIRSQQFKRKMSQSCKNSKKVKQTNKQLGLNKTHERKKYKFNCKKCGKQYFLTLTQNDFNKGKYSKHCSRKCANSRKQTQQTKRKISQSCKNSDKLKKTAKISGINRIKSSIIKICKFCGKQFETKVKTKQYCNSQCFKSHQKTKQSRKKMSKKMSNITKQTYIDGKIISPYTGKTKWHNIDTSIGKIKVQGTYQVRMCKILDKMKQLKQIKDWQYTNDRVQYIAEDNEKHTYLLDFKVYNSNGSFKYIETKGYIRQRDKYKWNSVRQKGFQLQVCFDKDIIQYQKKYNL